MKQPLQVFFQCLFIAILCAGTARGEIGDAVYRNQLEFAGLAVNWHTALTYRYDNGSKTRYVVEADSDIVRVGDTWASFLGNTGGTFQKQACPANLSLGMRQLVLQYATGQAGTPYWNYYSALAFGYFIGNPLGAYEDPTWITPGYGFRCDGLVEWVYEQINYNPCVDAQLYNAYGFAVVDWSACGPEFQSTQIPYATQTPPTGVTMTYPSSTDYQNPTIATSSTVTLAATASDADSGLSFNQPFDYYVSTWTGTAWTPWTPIASSGSSLSYAVTPGVNYSFYVRAYDNDGNWRNSTVYYLYVNPPVSAPTVQTTAATGVTSSSATLNATITSTGGASIVDARFEYTSTTFPGTVIYNVPVYGNTFSYNLTGLQPNTTYTYHAYAKNSAGLWNTNPNNVTFTTQPAYATISVNASPSSGGTVSGSGTYVVGSQVQISASPYGGWNFTGWGDGSTQNPRTVTVSSGGASYTAYFQQQTATIVVQVNPANGGSVSGSGTYTVGSQVQISASPNSGWTFKSWSDGNAQNPRTITVPSGGATYTANFQQQTATITVQANPSNGGSVSGSGTYSVGAQIQISASPGSGWTFTGWNDGNTQNPRTITVTTGGATYTANFQQQTATVTVLAGPTDGGSVSGSGTYAIDSQVQISANPNSGWIFTDWNDGNTQNPRTITVPSEGAIYTANFQQQTRIINLNGDLAFGNVQTGSTAQATMTISNAGNSTMTISGINYPSGFSGNWSGTIPASSSQPVTVTFAPTVVTSYNGTVMVNSDKTSGVNTIPASGTGTIIPPTTGSLQVSITPAAANSAGAQWQVDSGVWQNSDATVSGLLTGGHTVTFKMVSGWTTPGNQNVTINANQTTMATGNYVAILQTGSLQVNITPQGVMDAGAQWQVDGGAWQNSGATVSSLSAGDHPVAFKDVSGWTTPGNQTAAIVANQTTTLTGIYLAVVNNPLQLSGMAMSNGVFRLVLNGPLGSNYVIQVSSNLVDWVPFSTNTIPSGGLTNIIDLSTSNQPVRFYRAIPWMAQSQIYIPAASGEIMAPFILTNGYIYQPIQTTVIADGGEATYNFNIAQAGTYVIQTTVNAPDDGANSLFVNIDAEPQNPAMIWDISPDTSGFEQRTLSWRGDGTDTSNQFIPKVFNLTQGSHQLIIRGREANVQLQAITIEPYPAVYLPAASGTITAPFAITNNCIYQPILTTVVADGGRAEYDFTITNAGTYVIQATVDASGDNANSFFLNIDAEPQDPTMIWDIFPFTSGFEQRLASWRGTGTDTNNEFAPEIFDLTAGPHRLIIRGREADAELRDLAILPYP